MNTYFWKCAICYAQTEINFGICYMPKTPRKNFGKKVFRFGGVNRLLYRRGGDVKVTEKEKLQNRDIIACIYEQYKNYMYSLACKYASEHQDCDDIVQDAVMRLIHNSDTLGRMDEGQVVAYINLTVRSAALDLLDHKKICGKYFDPQPHDHMICLENPSGWENTVEEGFIKAERNTVTGVARKGYNK